MKIMQKIKVKLRTHHIKVKHNFQKNKTHKCMKTIKRKNNKYIKITP